MRAPRRDSSRKDKTARKWLNVGQVNGALRHLVNQVRLIGLDQGKTVGGEAHRIKIRSFIPGFHRLDLLNKQVIIQKLNFEYHGQRNLTSS